MTVKTYTLENGKTITGISQGIADYLSEKEDMETQILNLNDFSIVVQGRIRGAEYKKLAGVDRAITVRIFLDRDANALLEISHSKWLNKGVAGFLGVFVFAWPLAVSAAYGVYKQCRLPGKILAAAENYLNENTQEAVA